MKAFSFESNGEPAEVLRLAERQRPAPKVGEVLVRVLLAPVHAADLHVIRGRFGRKPHLPATPGVECVGVVEELGPGTSGPVPGTRVVLLDVWGTWAPWIVCPAERVVTVPGRVSDEDAAQALVNPLTARTLTMDEHALRKGEWLIQTAAGSTVGRLVLQYAKKIGFRTINVVRRRGQMDEIAELGGDVVLCSDDGEWSCELPVAAEGGRASKAIDCVAGPIGATVARSLAPGGKLLVFGALSTHRQSDPAAFAMPVFTPSLIYGATVVQGWFLFHWLVSRPVAQCTDALRLVLDDLATGTIRLPKATRYRPSQLGDALQAAEAPGRGGKPLLDFTQQS